MTLRYEGLNNPAIRHHVVQILKEHGKDRAAFPFIMDRIRDALDEDGLPFDINHPPAMEAARQYRAKLYQEKQ